MSDLQFRTRQHRRWGVDCAVGLVESAGVFGPEVRGVAKDFITGREAIIRAGLAGETARQTSARAARFVARCSAELYLPEQVLQQGVGLGERALACAFAHIPSLRQDVPEASHPDMPPLCTVVPALSQQFMADLIPA